MINLLNSKNRIQKIQAVQQVSTAQKISNIYNDGNKLTDIIPAFSIKALTSQIKAMAEQDKKIPIGEKLNLIV